MKLKKQLCIAGSCFLCALWLSTSAYAGPVEDTNSIQQQKGGNFGKTIKGKVTDANNEPIVGATIRIRDQNVGTITDIDGNYSLVYKGDTPKEILVSFIGYIGRAVRYNGQATLNVTLEEDAKLLDEVVVTGYQTISKERATGAFAILNNQAIEKKISSDLTQALEGQIAGVTTYGGDIVIRGRSTVSNAVGTNPLLVIDGLPTERSMDDININDVESLTVLKDAAASSIYGSRAANGVIVITMKQAEKGKVKVNFTADWKWEENPSLSDYHYLTTEQVLEYEPLLWERHSIKAPTPIDLDQYMKSLNTNGFGSSSGTYLSPLAQARIRVAEGTMSQTEYDAYVKELATYDYRQAYMDAMWRTPFRQNYNLSISNSSDRQNTYASITYTGDAMQMKTNDSRTIKANIKTTQKLAKWLSVDLGIDAQYGRKTETHSAFNFDNQASTFNPYTQIYNSDGSLHYLPYTPHPISGGSSWFPTGSVGFTPKRYQEMCETGQYESMDYNVVEEADRVKNKTNTLLLRSFAKINIQLHKDLKFSSSFDYETRKESKNNYVDKDSYFLRLWRNRFITRTGTAGNYTYNKTNFPTGSYLEQNESSRINYTFRNQLDYNKTIAGKHDISVLAGMEAREVKTPMAVRATYLGYDPQSLSVTSPLTLEQKSLLNTGVTSALFGNVTKFNTTLLNSGQLSETKHRYLSYYGAAGYTYNNLYNLSGSVRVDQTDLFGTDPKYRYRPLWSIGAGWNISNEKFMKDITWLDMLTIRGSYGVTGNVDQSSTPYITVTTGTTSGTMDTYPVVNISTAPNQYLRWEKTTSYSLGADFSLLQGLLSGKIEGYYKYSDDLLVPTSLPIASGYTTSTINNGAISNRGIEITLSSPWYKKNGWKLSSTLVYSRNKNRVEKVNRVATSASQLITQPYAYYQEGKPFNALYAYHCEGLRTDGSDYQNGMPIFKTKDGKEYYTINADGKSGTTPSLSTVSPDEAVYMGTLDPKWSGSFTQNIQYKNFELSVLCTFYGGHKIRKPSYITSGPAVSTVFNGTYAAELANGWTPENPNSTLTKSGMYYSSWMMNLGVYGFNELWRYSDYFVADGDMFRLKNVSLSYTLPQKYAKIANLSKVKLTGQVNNLWFWCAAGDDVDPETYTTTQINASSYKTPNAIDRTLPLMTSYLMRLEITF